MVGATVHRQLIADISDLEPAEIISWDEQGTSKMAYHLSPTAAGIDSPKKMASGFEPSLMRFSWTQPGRIGMASVRFVVGTFRPRQDNLRRKICKYICSRSGGESNIHLRLDLFVVAPTRALDRLSSCTNAFHLGSLVASPAFQAYLSTTCLCKHW